MTTSIDPMVRIHFEDGVARCRWMGSRLYSAFCRRILDDDGLLDLASNTRTGQPASHMLFGAVHWLLLGEGDGTAPPAAYYASLSPDPLHDDDGAFAAFRDFCFARRDDIIPMMKTRMVQFTLAGRAGFAFPTIAHVARLAGEPLSFIEVGCSAGLLTQFDRYSYDFGPAGRVGDPKNLAITSLRFVGAPPPFPLFIPKIGERVGIDLNPIDPSDLVERRWIDALCPPDMVEERRQLRAALDLRAATPLPVVKGDALTVVPGYLAAMPEPICLLHAHCLYQWPQDARDALDAELRSASRGRSIFRIAIEHPGTIDPSRATPTALRDSADGPIEHEGRLTVYRDGETTSTLLGRYDSFGRRAVWLAA